MNRIAFIIGEKFLYWNSIILALAVLSAICMFFALAVRNREDVGAAVAAIPVAFALSLLLSRFVHWYCRPQGYTGMFSALFDYSRGSFALIGVFAGCLLTAVLLRLFKVSKNLPRLLDQMCLAGALGIAVGRPAALFTTADRGIPVPDWVPFPLASRMANSVSGETEVRLAVFMLQAFIAAILFICLLIIYLKGKKKETLRDGDTCLLFLLWYCGSQAVLDSPRYDSLYFRSNGFVSIVQIFGIFTVILTMLIFTVRLIKCRRWSKFFLPFLTLPLLGLAGYMEYHVQRHGGQALFAYSVMSLSMLFAIILILRIRANAVPVIRYPMYDTHPRNSNMAYQPYPGAPESEYQPDYSRPQPPKSQNPAPRRPAPEQKPAGRTKKGRYQGKYAAKRK